MVSQKVAKHSRFIHSSGTKGKIYMRQLKNKQGFTLVELMIVVVILGILVAVAVPIFSAVSANARKKTCLNNIDMIERAVTQYLVDSGADDVYGVFKSTYTGGVTISSQADAEAKLSEAFLACFEGKNFPACPQGETYTITIKENSENRAITVECAEHGKKIN